MQWRRESPVWHCKSSLNLFISVKLLHSYQCTCTDCYATYYFRPYPVSMIICPIMTRLFHNVGVWVSWGIDSPHSTLSSVNFMVQPMYVWTFILFCHTSGSSFPGTEVCHGCPSTRLDTFNIHRCCASSHLVDTSAYALIVHQLIYLFTLNYPPYSDLCLASWINLSKSHGVPPTFVQGRQKWSSMGITM